MKLSILFPLSVTEKDVIKYPQADFEIMSVKKANSDREDIRLLVPENLLVSDKIYYY